MTDRRTFIRPLATRSIVVDVAWAVLAALVFLLPLEVELEHASFFAVLAAAGAIALRRVSPSAAMLMVVVLGIIQVGGGERPSLVDLAIFVVIGTAAVVGTRTEVILSGVLALVAGVGATFYLAVTGFRYLVLLNGPRDQAFLAMAAPVAALLGVWAGGVAVRAFRSRDRESVRRADAEAAASRAEAVATEAEATATRAIDVAESERIRADIARDVHDVVGHSLAVIIAQADSVPFLADEARVREVSATIASTARSSLVEVRQVLGHIDGSGSTTDPGSLEEIVQGIRDAGVDVDRTVRGVPVPLRPDTGTAARRVLQEMLTNALRHGAPGLPVVVRETWRSADVVLEVENVVGDGTTGGSGRGIDGMHTRLTALGGSFDAAALDDVFAARARIPFDVQGGPVR
ncbi:sensor histidine kinase [Curtobacterium sp. VKM Ac-2884]|uniref:sensor histidine kinase n=1 Tax=Curtobacterium sp. VKM Ac-2884 TaxID=2783818 RepID=UPI00188B6EE0|nr:histidine kinase [Curtobacterium sp. VKM Ac-2884]MBF4603277.1 two-component sensor histidine kinase [Curtobacterium sp. VKM Ac-2884]